MGTLAESARSSIRDRLLAIIRASGYSVRQLAALAALPPETLRRYVTRGEMPVSSFLALARALRLDPAAILDAGDPGNVTEAQRIADLIAPLGPAERSALRGLLEAAVELRTAAVLSDRQHAGLKAPPSRVTASDVLALPTLDEHENTPMPDDDAPTKRRRKAKR